MPTQKKRNIDVEMTQLAGELTANCEALRQRVHTQFAAIDVYRSPMDERIPVARSVLRLAHYWPWAHASDRQFRDDLVVLADTLLTSPEQMQAQYLGLLKRGLTEADLAEFLEFPELNPDLDEGDEVAPGFDYY